MEHRGVGYKMDKKGRVILYGSLGIVSLFILIYFVVFIYQIQFVSATDTGAISPGTMTDDDAVGDMPWTSVDNAKASDNLYAYDYNGIGYEESVYDYAVKIVKSDGSIGSEDKASVSAWPSSDAYSSYGGVADLWSEEWTAEDINNANFGVVISAYSTYGTMHYLKATNFGFSIPNGATINGILVGIEKQSHDANGAKYPYVDHIRITVYYTEGAEDTCTCAGDGNNWEIDLSDYCIISDNCDLGVGNITFINTGNITFDATITAFNIGDLPDNQRGYLTSSAEVRVG